ncbi:MAG: CBS domain-containing protein [Spirochaetes bacterium]|nr:CBS domain-containing protein [Spirochaetota bacterium]MBN2771952.1 CBS domain-containing protein [Spirochaetota bacterium]
MTANDLLKRQIGGLFSVSANTSVHECAALMSEKHVGALVVLDAKDNLIGIVSERDIIRILSKKQISDSTTVKEIMVPSEKIISSQKTDSITDVMEKMNENYIRHIVIKDGDKLLGLGSIRDVVRMVLDSTLLENQQLKDYVYQAK